MKFPPTRRDHFRSDAEDRSALVPTHTRAVGWFWLAGVMGFVGSLQGRDLSVALPAGVGIIRGAARPQPARRRDPPLRRFASDEPRWIW